MSLKISKWPTLPLEKNWKALNIIIFRIIFKIIKIFIICDHRYVITNKGVIQLWLAEPWILQRCTRGGLGRRVSLYHWASPPILSGSMSFVLSFIFKYSVFPHELHLRKSFAAFGCSAQSWLLFGAPGTIALQTPLPMEFSRQECWSAISSSRGPSQPRVWSCTSCVSCIGRQILTTCATWEAAKTNVLEK